MYSSGVSKMSKPRFDMTDRYEYKEPLSSSENICQYVERHDNEKHSDGISDKIMSFVKDLSFDDILIIAIFILLLNENKQDDYLILLILAVLFFS